MFKIATSVIFCAIFANFAYASSPLETSIILTADERILLENGKTIVSVKKIMEDSVKSAEVFGVIQIDATPSEIWPVMTDCTRAPDYVPGLIKCEILQESSDGNWDIRRHSSKSAAFLPKITSEFRCDYTKNRYVDITRTGGDLNAMTGRWTLEPTAKGAKTIVSYRARFSSKSLVPDSMIRRSMRKNIPNVLVALRDEVLGDKILEKTQE